MMVSLPPAAGSAGISHSLDVGILKVSWHACHSLVPNTNTSLIGSSFITQLPLLIPNLAAVQKTQEKSHHPPTSSFVQSTSVLISSSISIHPTSTLPSTSPADEQPTAVLTVTEVVRDYRVLIFAVPTAVCTTLLVLVIVTVGVLLCLKHGRGRNWRR